MLGDLIVDCSHVPFKTEIHPPDVPTHIHRHLAADRPNAQGRSVDNPRMRSDYASNVAGGLVEVYWQ